VRQVDTLEGLYRDARSTEYKNLSIHAGRKVAGLEKGRDGTNGKMLCGGGSEVLSILVTYECPQHQMNLGSDTARLLCCTERVDTMADRNANCEQKKLIIFELPCTLAQQFKLFF